jgi:hypothetical protein
VTAFSVGAPATEIVTGLLCGEVYVWGGIVESVTVGKKLKTPDSVGVPEICPFAVLKVSPVGRLFAGRLQEYGGVPPEA